MNASPVLWPGLFMISGRLPPKFCVTGGEDAGVNENGHYRSGPRASTPGLALFV
jgi:hypothetical protein